MASDEMFINYGPQHPSAHGVLRLVLELDGETVRRADPHIGFLHRGTEKLLEEKTYLQGLHYFDRVDYIAPVSGEYSYVLAVEEMFGVEVPKRAKFIRVIIAEINRIINHVLMISSLANDIGAITPVLWGFEQREIGLGLMEKISGARMHPGYFRFGGVAKDIPEGFLDEVRKWIGGELPDTLKDLEKLLTNSPIFRARTEGIGVVDREGALKYGFSGPNLRASGVFWDLRKMQNYDAYDMIDFDVPVAKNGDCYSRYLIRVEEIKQSIEIIRQAIKYMPQGSVCSDDYKIAVPPRDISNSSMEEMIHSFKHFSYGFDMPEGEIYRATEGSKGEFGVYIVSAGGEKPYRCHMRTPSFAHLQALDVMAKDHTLSDISAILGSLDLVFGEVDR